MNNYQDYQDHEELSTPQSARNYQSGYQPGQQNGDDYMYQNGEGSVTGGDYLPHQGSYRQNPDSYRSAADTAASYPAADQGSYRDNSYRQQVEETNPYRLGNNNEEGRAESYTQDTAAAAAERQPDLYASNQSERAASREQLRASREQLRASREQLQASREQLQNDAQQDTMRTSGDPMSGSRAQLDRPNYLSNPNYQDDRFYSDQRTKPEDHDRFVNILYAMQQYAILDE